MKKIFDLPVCGYDRAKSFYGKAKIIETENGKKFYSPIILLFVVSRRR